LAHKHPGIVTPGNKAVMMLTTDRAQDIPNSQLAILATMPPVSAYMNMMPIMMVATTDNTTATCPLRLLATAQIGPSHGMGV
jgi:hypothetical protein